jgi:hypothetical protein
VQVDELKAICWYAPDGQCMRRSQTFAIGTVNVGLLWDACKAPSPTAEAEPNDGVIAAPADRPMGAEHCVLLLADVHEMPLTSFKRASLAAFYGIRGVALRCYRDGVLEMGSKSNWAQMPSAAHAAFRLDPVERHEADDQRGSLGLIPEDIALVLAQSKHLTELQARSLWRRYASGGEALGYAEVRALLEDMHEATAGASRRYASAHARPIDAFAACGL